MAIILSTEPKMARWMMTGRALSSPSFLWDTRDIIKVIVRVIWLQDIFIYSHRSRSAYQQEAIQCNAFFNHLKSISVSVYAVCRILSWLYYFTIRQPFSIGTELRVDQSLQRHQTPLTKRVILLCRRSCWSTAALIADFVCVILWIQTYHLELQSHTSSLIDAAVDQQLMYSVS